MKILWFTWKDHHHPTAGGAEKVLFELSQRLIADSHEVTWLTCGYEGAPARERLDGVDIIRVGSNRFVHPFQALGYYMRHLRGKFDVVIEVVNTAPYFGVFFGKGAKRFLFYHQLAREIWFYETKPPMSNVGYRVLEPLATKLLARAHVPTITVSESTRLDLARYGFELDDTHVISQGIQLQPIGDLRAATKFARRTMLSFGALRAMKRTKDQIKAFELAKQTMPDLQLKIAGSASDAYGREVLERIKRSPYAADIEYLGRISDADKAKLMQQSHVITVTSVKEGWGLIVSEAASQGTPAVVYDVDGLRDSVRDGETGVVTEPNPKALAKGIEALLRSDDTYTRLRWSAWDWSKQLTFDHAYHDFKQVLEAA